MISDHSSSVPISIIKISQPARRAEIVSRPRLIDSLHDLLDKKLILIVAPAGYGKTSLLIDLVSNSELPVCWLALDSLDQEPQRFLSYLVASIAQRFEQYGRESLAALQNLTSVEKDSERLIISISNEIKTTISEHFVLVLDDYHLIDTSPSIGRLLSRFMQLTGENVHIILSSRTLPNIPDMPLMVARDIVAGLSYEEMAFQPSEIQQFFTQNYQTNLDSEEAEKLSRETEGWIAAIHLTGALPSTKRPARLFAASADLFDFFAEEILDKQSPTLREFLLTTALFEAFNSELCQAVLDPLLPGEKRDWAALVAEIQSNNLFTVPLGPDGRWMRYHNLFRRFLQARLEYENPTLAWHIQNGLARYYEKQELWEEALHLYESLGDMDRLVQVFAQAGIAFIRQGRLLTLSNWLRRVPAHLLQNEPILISLQGAILATQGDPHNAVATLSRAENAFRTKGDTGNLVRTLTRRAVAYRRQGETALMLADAEDVIRLSQNHSGALQEFYAEAQRLKGQALHLMGQTKEAIKCMEASLKLYIQLDSANDIPIVDMDLGMLYRASGNNAAAEDFYNKALVVWERSGNMGWQAILLNNLGMLYQIQGNYDKAFVAFERGLHASEQCGDLYTQALILSSLADLLIDMNDIDQARKNQERAFSIAQQLNDSYLIFYSTLTNARLAYLSGHVNEAASILNDLSARSENASAYRQSQIEIEHGCNDLSSGQPLKAITTLKKGLSLLEQSGSNDNLCKAHIWLGTALLQTNQAEGLKILEHLSSHQCMRLQPGILFAGSAPVLPILERSLTGAQLTPLLKNFITSTAEFLNKLPEVRRRLRRTSQRVQISQPRFEIRTLGKSQVIRDGHPISLSEWQTRETRELFFYFLLTSRALTKEQIGLTFWPDVTPARLKMRFKTNIYRLRHAVGQEVILFENDHYRFNRRMDYTLDLDDFEVLLKTASASKNDVEAARFLQKAVNHVNGPFLADIDTEWVMHERTRIQSTYQTALLRLAEINLKLGNLDDCLEACQLALTSDPLLESAYRIRMRAFAAKNDRVAVFRQYQQCRDILETELGIEPSKETTDLFQLLTIIKQRI